MRKPVAFRCREHIWTNRTGDFSIRLECLLPLHPRHEEHHWKIADDHGRVIEIRWESSAEVFEPLGPDPELAHIDGMESMILAVRS